MPILFALGLVLRFELAELIIAPTICIADSSSAQAIASAKGWRDLLIPGIRPGSMGYGISSFIGVWLVGWLGQ